MGVSRGQADGPTAATRPCSCAAKHVIFTEMRRRIIATIQHRIEQGGPVVVLTGAGISAASGIPTFRGPEGFWTIGAREFTPEEMATRRMFQENPEAVWQWYLYRLGLCRNAAPNTAHLAVAAIEAHLRDRFLLITQNVDGLHLRAGSTPARTFQIHGNIAYARCARDCDATAHPLPEWVRPKARDERLSRAEIDALRCERCGSHLRPHVLWFDESYNETYYRFNSAVNAAMETDVLITVGTSGATNLPLQVGRLAAAGGAYLVDINPAPNPFSEMAVQTGGAFLEGDATDILPELATAVAGDRRTDAPSGG